MNKSSKTRRLQKKKIVLQEVKEDDYDEGLLTNEEIQIMKANQKTIKTNSKNMTRSDYLVDEYSYNQRTKNNQYSSGSLSTANTSFTSIRNNQRQKSKSRNISIDEYDEEEEEDVLNKLGEEDVNVILQDVIKTKDSTAQKKNQDYFCQILAQMILKNKINKENAFEIPLPDVQNMSDFAKVSEASWQKLSSSLDSGSKIYGYRVDSLHQESFKMLGGLIRSEYQYKDNDQQSRSEDDSEDLINKEREKIFKKNKRINEETIEKNISNITLNKYDIQFEVDPLFCKTSAKFDDGSSKGILLNNISLINTTSYLKLFQIDANLKLLIDSENFVHKLPDASGRKQNPEVNTPQKQEKSRKQEGNTQYNKLKELSRNQFKIRKDINELELCNELEYFVNNLLTFDDSSRKIKSKLLEDSNEQNQQMNIMNDIAMNENEEELINDIQTILTQTAQKGRIASQQKSKKFEMINEIPENDYEQDQEQNVYSQRSGYMTPYHQLNVKDNEFESISKRMNQNSINHNQMEVLNEGTQGNYFSEQPYFNDDNDNNSYSQQQDNFPEYSSSQFRLLTEDFNSKQSSTDFSSDTNTEYDNRLFSLQNMAIRMTQIGNGQFLNQIEQFN